MFGGSPELKEREPPNPALGGSAPGLRAISSHPRRDPCQGSVADSPPPLPGATLPQPPPLSGSSSFSRSLLLPLPVPSPPTMQFAARRTWRWSPELVVSWPPSAAATTAAAATGAAAAAGGGGGAGASEMRRRRARL